MPKNSAIGLVAGGLLALAACGTEDPSGAPTGGAGTGTVGSPSSGGFTSPSAGSAGVTNGGASTGGASTAGSNAGGAPVAGAGGTGGTTGGTATAGGGAGGTGGGGTAGGGAGGTAGGGTAGGGTAGGGTAGGGTAGGGAGGGGSVTCPATTGLQVERLTATKIADLGQPFGTDTADKVSPWDWSTNYGKTPEIIALPAGTALDVLFQDHSKDSDAATKNARLAYLVRLEPSGGGYAITRAYRIHQLARIMGLSRDDAGNYYVATGVDEDSTLTPTSPAEGEHRSGIVRLVKFDTDGCVSLQIDADIARQTAKASSEPIINPMVAATSRLAYHDGRLTLVHGINTGYDAGVSARHQKALSTHFNATTGAVTRTESMWVSHSFDQRLFWDGTGFLELHLGDAYPRSISLGRFNDASNGTDTYELYKLKGDLGNNNTFTRLGGIAPIASGDYGYLVAFTTERNTDTAALLNGTRDLAVVRVRRDFATLDEKGSAFVDGASTQAVTSAGKAVTNKLTWLTDLAGAAQADRPRITAISGDRFVIVWERWTGTANNNAVFGGTYGMVVDGAGSIITAAAKLSDHHVPRGDDLVTLGGRALSVLGNASAKKLVLSFVGDSLATESIEIP